MANKKITNMKRLNYYKSKSEKVVKVYFCPKCESKEVGFVFRFSNIFGIIPKMECKQCKFKSGIFPLLSINKIDLERENKKAKKKIKKKEETK